MRPTVRLPGAWRDAALYGAGALVCLLVAWGSSHAIHSRAARLALPVYVVAAIVAATLALVERRADRDRLWPRVVLAVVVLAIAGIGVQAVFISERADDLTGHHSHSETALVEEGARTLVEGNNPYDTEFDGEGISFWSPRIRSHLPFMPAMLAFGLPRALFGASPLDDGRVIFLGAASLLLGAGLAFWRAPADRKLLVFQVLLVLPTGALIMAGGGHDLPVLALLFLSLVLLDRRALVASALVLGLAIATRQNAAVCLPFFALAAGLTWRDRLRYGGTAVLAGLAVVVPFGIWNAAALFEDTVLWPVNLGHEVNNAEAPTVGSLIVDASNAPGWLVTAVLLAGAVAAMAWLAWRRPPTTAAGAAAMSGAALFLLVVLAPSGRFGYLLYPVNLLVWAWAMTRTPASVSDASPDRGLIDLTNRPTELVGGAVTETLQSLHALAEHALAAALFASKRRIGLRQSVGGFATPDYPVDGGVRRVRIRGTDLVVEDDDLNGNKSVREQPVTTLGAAGAFVDAPGGFTADVYPIVTDFDADRALELDAAEVARIAEAYAVGQAALVVLCSELVADDPADIQLWPEHLDLATSIAEVNYGVSPGDANHDGPYLYVGPWSPPETGGFWNESFGASQPLEPGSSTDAALVFFREGRARSSV